MELPNLTPQHIKDGRHAANIGRNLLLATVALILVWVITQFTAWIPIRGFARPQLTYEEVSDMLSRSRYGYAAFEAFQYSFYTLFSVRVAVVLAIIATALYFLKLKRVFVVAAVLTLLLLCITLGVLIPVISKTIECKGNLLTGIMGLLIIFSGCNMFIALRNDIREIKNANNQLAPLSFLFVSAPILACIPILSALWAFFFNKVLPEESKPAYMKWALIALAVAPVLLLFESIILIFISFAITAVALVVVYYSYYKAIGEPEDAKVNFLILEGGILVALAVVLIVILLNPTYNFSPFSLPFVYRYNPWLALHTATKTYAVLGTVLAVIAYLCYKKVDEKN